MEPPAEPVAPPTEPVEAPAPPAEPAAPAAPTADQAKPADQPAKLAAVTAQAMPTVKKSNMIGVQQLTPPTASQFTIMNPSVPYTGGAQQVNITPADGVGNITNTKYQQSGLDVSPTAVGTYTVLVTVEAGTVYDADTDIGTFTITKKEVTIEVKNTPWQHTYDKTTDIAVTPGDVDFATGSIVAGETVTLDNLTATLESAGVKEGVVVTLTATLGGSHADNYTLPSEMPTATANITPIMLALDVTGTLTHTYDGETAIADASSVVALNDTAKLAGDEVTLGSVSAVLDSADVANGVGLTIVSTLEGADAANYTLPASTPGTANIVQADGSALVLTPPAETVATAGEAVNIAFTDVLPELDGSKDYGTVTYTVDSGGDIFTTPPTTNNALAGTIDPGTLAGEKTVQMSVTSTNYKDLQTFNVPIKVVALITDIVYIDGNAPYTGDTLTYEEASSATYPDAAAVYTYTAESGGATLEDGKPLTAGVYNATVTLTASDAKGTKTAEFTVTAADLTAVTATLAGTPEVGETLTATLPGFNLRTGDVTWAWEADGALIGGATSATYVLDAADVGKEITAKATAASGNLTGTSLPSSGVTIAAKPITGTVSITTSPAGPILEGTTLTADVTQVDPAAAQGGLSLQWNKNGTPIAGETNPTYQLPSGVKAGDKFTVTATASGGYSGTLTSAPAVVDTIAITGSVTISGGTALDSVLTATATVNETGATYNLQWMRDGVAISGADETTYTIARADLGKNITVKAVGYDNYSGEIVSAAVKADDLKTYPITVQPKPYDPSSGEGITFTIDADFAKFQGLSVNGQTLVRDKDYTAKAGSIVITLLPAYLDTLAAGTYDVRVALTDGEVVLNITIPQASTDPAAPGTTQPGTTGTTPKTTTRDGTTPRTGDEAPIALLVLLVGVMGAGAAFAIVMKRRVRSR